MEFHNSALDMNKLFYNSHVDIIKKVCEELDVDDKVDELIEKLLSKTYIKIKAMKDPERPKKGKTSYMFFAEDKRPEIRKESPDASMGEISKKIGEKWQSLSDKEKQPYISLAHKDKERYEEEMESYKNK
jgi:hypothetical protein